MSEEFEIQPYAEFRSTFGFLYIRDSLSIGLARQMLDYLKISFMKYEEQKRIKAKQEFDWETKYVAQYVLPMVISS